MKLGIMQPYIFPYIGYFQVIHAVDKYILYENLDYIKEGWIHRNRILIKSGEPKYITINIEAKSSYTKISEIKLCKNDKWKKKILNTIKFNYSRSSYFQEIFPLVEKIVNKDFDNIHIYNSNCIITICDYLDISTKIQYSNQNYLEMENLLDDEYDQEDKNRRISAPYGDLEKKTARVIKMCEKEGADVFINAPGGEKLYKKEVFKEYGIHLYFVETEAINYPQFSHSFVPNLSIIDVLMHCGKEKTKDLLKKYRLK